MMNTLKNAQAGSEIIIDGVLIYKGTCGYKIMNEENEDLPQTWSMDYTRWEIANIISEIKMKRGE